jgi:hypothetical protein
VVARPGDGTPFPVRFVITVFYGITRSLDMMFSHAICPEVAVRIQQRSLENQFFAALYQCPQAIQFGPVCADQLINRTDCRWIYEFITHS